jgi:hypothetical protein
MTIAQLLLQVLAILFSTFSAIVLAYISWSPEAERSGHVINQRNFKRLQAFINGKVKYTSDRQYVILGMTLLLIGVVFQMGAIALGL